MGLRAPKVKYLTAAYGWGLATVIVRFG